LVLPIIAAQSIYRGLLFIRYRMPPLTGGTEIASVAT
jgi:hypothetical protein